MKVKPRDRADQAGADDEQIRLAKQVSEATSSEELEGKARDVSLALYKRAQQVDLGYWGDALDRVDETLAICVKAMANQGSLLVAPEEEEEKDAQSNGESGPANTSGVEGSALEAEQVPGQSHDKEGVKLEEKDLPKSPESCVVACLQLLLKLLERGRNRGVFNSVEHVTAFLSSQDENIVDLALEVLAAAVTSHNEFEHPDDDGFAERSKLEGKRETSKLLMCFVQTWGTRALGFDLRSCVTEPDGSPKLPSIGGELHFEYFRVSEKEKETNQREIAQDEQSETVRITRTTEQVSEARDASALFHELVKAYNVPRKYHFSLLQRVRLAHGFGTREGRVRRVKERLLALTALLGVESNRDLMQLLILNEPELPRELATLVDDRKGVPALELHGKLDTPASSGSGAAAEIPFSVATLALQTLEAMAQDRPEGKGARETSVLQALGCTKGDSYSLLLSLIRGVASTLEAHASQISAVLPAANTQTQDDVAVKQGEEDAKPPPAPPAIPVKDLTDEQFAWMKGILRLAFSVVALQAGAAALTDAGLLHTLVNTLRSEMNLRRKLADFWAASCLPRRTNIISLAVFTVDRTIDSYSSAAKWAKDLDMVDLSIDLLYAILRRGQCVCSGLSAFVEPENDTEMSIIKSDASVRNKQTISSGDVEMSESNEEKPKNTETDGETKGSVNKKGESGEKEKNSKAKDGDEESVGSDNETIVSDDGITTLRKGLQTIRENDLHIAEKALVHAIVTILATLHVSTNVRIGNGGMSDRLRSHSSKLNSCIRCLFENCESFVEVTFARTAGLLSEVLDADPVSAQAVYRSGLAKAGLSVINDGRLPAADACVQAAPPLVTSLCLSLHVLDIVENEMTPGPVEQLVRLFTREKFTKAISRNCVPGLGDGLASLVQSFQSLRPKLITACIKLIKDFLAQDEPDNTSLYDTLQVISHVVEHHRCAKLFVDEDGLLLLLQLYPKTLFKPERFILRTGDEFKGQRSSIALTVLVMTTTRNSKSTLPETINQLVQHLGTLVQDVRSIFEKHQSILDLVPMDITKEEAHKQDLEAPTKEQVQQVSRYFHLLTNVEWLCQLLSKLVHSSLPSTSSMRSSRALAGDFLTAEHLKVLDELTQIDRVIRWHVAQHTISAKQTQVSNEDIPLRHACVHELHRFNGAVQLLVRYLSRLCYSGGHRFRASSHSSACTAQFSRKIAFKVSDVLFNHVQYLKDKGKAQSDDEKVAKMVYRAGVLVATNKCLVESKKATARPNLVLLHAFQQLNDDKDRDGDGDGDGTLAKSSPDTLELLLSCASDQLDSVLAMPSLNARTVEGLLEPVAKFLHSLMGVQSRVRENDSNPAVLESWPSTAELTVQLHLEIARFLQPRWTNPAWAKLPQSALNQFLPLIGVIISLELSDKHMLPNVFSEDEDSPRDRDRSLAEDSSNPMFERIFRMDQSRPTEAFEPDEAVVGQLMEVGFPRAHVLNGMTELRRNDPNLIIGWLLSHPHQPDESTQATEENTANGDDNDNNSSDNGEGQSENEEDELARALRLSLEFNDNDVEDGAQDESEDTSMSTQAKEKDEEVAREKQEKEAALLAKEDEESQRNSKYFADAEKRRTVFREFRESVVSVCISILQNVNYSVKGASGFVKSIASLLSKYQRAMPQMFCDQPIEALCNTINRNSEQSQSGGHAELATLVVLLRLEYQKPDALLKIQETSYMKSLLEQVLEALENAAAKIPLFLEPALALLELCVRVSGSSEESSPSSFLTHSNLKRCVEACARLLADQAKNLKSEHVQPILLLLVRLFSDFSLVQNFWATPGARSALFTELTSKSRFDGHATLVGLLLTKAVEDPASLRLSMAATLISTMKALEHQYSSNRAIPLKALVKLVEPMQRRNGTLFREACEAVLLVTKPASSSVASENYVVRTQDDASKKIAALRERGISSSQQTTLTTELINKAMSSFEAAVVRHLKLREEQDMASNAAEEEPFLDIGNLLLVFRDIIGQQPWRIPVLDVELSDSLREVLDTVWQQQLGLKRPGNNTVLGWLNEGVMVSETILPPSDAQSATKSAFKLLAMLTNHTNNETRRKLVSSLCSCVELVGGSKASEQDNDGHQVNARMFAIQNWATLGRLALIRSTDYVDAFRFEVSFHKAPICWEAARQLLAKGAVQLFLRAFSGINIEHPLAPAIIDNILALVQKLSNRKVAAHVATVSGKNRKPTGATTRPRRGSATSSTGEVQRMLDAFEERDENSAAQHRANHTSDDEAMSRGADDVINESDVSMDQETHGVLTDEDEEIDEDEGDDIEIEVEMDSAEEEVAADDDEDDDEEDEDDDEEEEDEDGEDDEDEEEDEDGVEEEAELLVENEDMEEEDEEDYDNDEEEGFQLANLSSEDERFLHALPSFSFGSGWLQHSMGDGFAAAFEQMDEADSIGVPLRQRMRSRQGARVLNISDLPNIFRSNQHGDGMQLSVVWQNDGWAQIERTGATGPMQTSNTSGLASFALSDFAGERRGPTSNGDQSSTRLSRRMDQDRSARNDQPRERRSLELPGLSSSATEMFPGIGASEIADSGSEPPSSPQNLSAEVPIEAALTHPLLAVEQPSASSSRHGTRIDARVAASRRWHPWRGGTSSLGNRRAILSPETREQLARWSEGNSYDTEDGFESIVNVLEATAVEDDNHVDFESAVQSDEEDGGHQSENELESGSDADSREGESHGEEEGVETSDLPPTVEGTTEVDTETVSEEQAVDQTGSSAAMDETGSHADTSSSPPDLVEEASSPSSDEEMDDQAEVDAATEVQIEAGEGADAEAGSNEEMEDQTEAESTPNQLTSGVTPDVAEGTQQAATELPIPPGVDAEVWADLPDFMRIEILTQQGMLPASSQPAAASSSTSATTGANDDFLAAMPDDIRQELIQENERNSNSNASGGAAGADAQESGVSGEDMDPASFIASLDPELRREVLLTTDDEVLRTLPPHMRAEALLLRQRLQGQSHRQRHYLPNEAETTNESAPRTEERKDEIKLEMEAPGKALVQKQEVHNLSLVLFLLQLSLFSTRASECFHNICAHPKSRALVVNALLTILAPREPKGNEFPSRMLGCPVDSELALAPSTTTSSSFTAPDGSVLTLSPPLVAKRTLDLLIFLASKSRRVNLHLLADSFTLNSHEELVEVFPDGSEQGCLETLLDLLKLREFSLSTLHLTRVVDLLNVIVKPLANLPEPKTDGEDEGTDDKSTTKEARDEGNTSNMLDDSDTQVAASEKEKEKKNGKGKEAKKEKPEQEVVLVPEREVEAEYLKQLANVLTLDSCTNATFSKATTVVQHLAKVPKNRNRLLQELCLAAETLGSRAVEDLVALQVLLEAEAELDESLTGNTIAFSSSSNELKLLRVLKTVRNLTDSPEVLDELCAGVRLDSLWKSLSACLRAVSASDEDEEGIRKGSSNTECTFATEAQVAPLDDAAASPTEANVSSMTEGAQSSKAGPKHSVAIAFAHARLPIIKAFFIVNGFSKSEVKEEKSTVKLESGLEAQQNQAGNTVSPDEKKPSRAEVDKRESMLVDFVTKNGRLLNELVSQTPTLLDNSFACLINNPRCRSVLDFDNKREYFRVALKKLQRNSRAPSIRLEIRRPHVFEDSFSFIKQYTAEEMRGRLSISFAGEEGIDAGGVTREWYAILAREIFRPGYALFKPSADSSAYQPDPRSYIVGEHLEYFRFVGRIVGKAILDGQLLDAHFTRSMYKHVLGRKVTPQDMQSIDPQYYRSLMELLQMDIEELGLELSFTADTEDFGIIRTTELIPGGANIPVTEKNKREYIRLATQHKMTTGIRKQLDAFMEGFNELVPHDLIKIFDENELELLISGIPEIDLDDLKQNTEYVSYTASSPQVRWFWRTIDSLHKDEHAKFLMFVTGTSKVPLEGFKGLVGMRGLQKFSINKAYGDNNALPTAHTCFNQLDLPEYTTEEALREKLLYAVKEGGEGFGFG